MALTVNTLTEVPEADGFIVEIGLEDCPDHPANRIERDQIRDELNDGEWYVRTKNQDEEQRLILEVDEFDHSRLPAFVVLVSHPTEVTDGTAIYFDEVNSEEEAWWVLQQAVLELRTSIEENGDTEDVAERVKLAIVTAERPLHITASAVNIVQFGVSVVSS